MVLFLIQIFLLFLLSAQSQARTLNARRIVLVLLILLRVKQTTSNSHNPNSLVALILLLIRIFRRLGSFFWLVPSSVPGEVPYCRPSHINAVDPAYWSCSKCRPSHAPATDLILASSLSQAYHFEFVTSNPNALSITFYTSIIYLSVRSPKHW